MNAALLPFRRYFQFSGRAPRSEYWLFTLLVIVVLLVAIALDNVLGLGGSYNSATTGASGNIGFSFSANGGILSIIWSLATIIPGLAVSIRRLHDLDRSGWWILIGIVPLAGAIVLLVFFCTAGTRGPNRFGPDPLPAA